ncbi:hypothetical protein [Spiroplasma alleghenense]|uniref:Uncharacterized protein n=1 Tax=Spiroplasma alleghenense TaxID=216931 RepID=A0A345Z504_9MOLU|nr:hypothetical protein [Spiroplasma alleghenense]AXK51683.1 hypothetical protein SALLE_v1c10130 [Spiroplasma alleghenense]
MNNKKIIVLIQKENNKPIVVIDPSSDWPAEIKEFIDDMNISIFDKKCFNKNFRKSLKEYEIKMSKCSQEIEQELLKSNKIWEEKLKQLSKDYQLLIDKMTKILIKNNLISDISEI